MSMDIFSDFSRNRVKCTCLGTLPQSLVVSSSVAVIPFVLAMLSDP